MTAREKRFKPGSSGRRMDPTKKPKNAPTPSFSRFNKNSKGIRPKLTKSQRLKRMALGGEAGESVGRATVVKSQRDARRKEVDEMLQRLYYNMENPQIKPKLKKKPKNPNRIKPKKKPKKP
jgi:hypothetical protein